MTGAPSAPVAVRSARSTVFPLNAETVGAVVLVVAHVTFAVRAFWRDRVIRGNLCHIHSPPLECVEARDRTYVRSRAGGSIQQSCELRKTPGVVSDTGGHRRRALDVLAGVILDRQRRVDEAKVVVHEVKRNGVRKVLDLL